MGSLLFQTGRVDPALYRLERLRDLIGGGGGVCRAGE